MIVSVCVVAYNEEKVLGNLLNDIKAQDYEHSKIEVVLIDSMSTDHTKDIMRDFQQQTSDDFKKIQVLENLKKKQASGWNVAIRNFSGDVMIRVDAHASIPPEFVRKNVEILESGEMVSGGPRPNMIDESTPWKETLLLAEQSMFGSSMASYRRSQKKQYVKSLFHGAYRREVLEKVNGFDEQLGRTEDNEFHYRIRQAGYQICYSPEIISYQHARSTLPGMLKQKYGNGYWVALTLKACPGCLAIYHFVPFAFIGGIIVTSVLAACHHSLLAKMMWGAYSCLAIIMSLMAVKGKKKYWQELLLPFLFFLLHVSYGIGSLVGFLKLPFWKYKKCER